MVVGRVIADNEVFLGGVLFPIFKDTKVLEVPQNIFPPKRVDGDYTRDSNPRLSSITFSDFRGGIGLDIMEGNQVTRCWDTTLNIRFKRNILLAELATKTAAATGSPGFAEAINEYNNEVFAAFDTKVHKYNNGSDSWGSSLQTLAAGSVEDSINITLDSTEYLIISYRTGYDFWDGSTWASSTKDAAYFVDWDDRLWGIARSTSNTVPAQLWYSLTPGTEIDAATLPRSAGQPTDMVVYRDATGESVIYVVAENGLYVYDAANDRFISTPLAFPLAGENAQSGKALVWKDILYVSGGQSLFEIISGGGRTQISNVGPDRDDGLDTAFRTLTLSDMASSISELFVVLASSITNLSHLMAYNGLGWRFVTDTNFNLGRRGEIFLSDTYGKYRVWAPSVTDQVLFIAVDDSLLNPKKNSQYTYSAAGELKTPWFHADQVDVDKLAVRAKVETADTNSNETVTVSYALDYNDGIYNQFDTITTNGIKTLSFSKWHTYLDFDGASGDVTVSDATSIQNQFDSGAEISIRIYANSDGENNAGRIVDKAIWQLNASGEASNAVKIQFGYDFSGDDGTWTSTDTVINLGEWYRVSVSYDNGAASNNPTIGVYREATRTLTTLTVDDGLTESTTPKFITVSVDVQVPSSPLKS